MTIRPLHKAVIYAVFGISGFCALVYEILWAKYLSLTFGTTILAVSIVTATFMGGLALGGYLFGRRADRETNPLRTYAWLELGIALTALLFPTALHLVEWAYVSLSRTCPHCLALSTTFRFIFSALLLLPPAAFMGGTFPLMCRFFARKKSGGQIGRLYALNTLGATLGAFSAGFFLVPTLGLSATGILAAAVNLLIAGAAYLLSKQIFPGAARSASLQTRPDQPLPVSQHRLVLAAIGLIGAFSLGYEILWTRVLLLFLGNTTYAFSLMLSAFLVGIALGGAIYARKVQTGLDEKDVFIRLSGLMGLSILVCAPFYDQLAHLFQFAHEASGERWWHLCLLSFLIVFAVMSIPAILSGSLLPAAVAIMDPGRSHTGEGVGLVVLCNTVGGVLGSLLAGFLLIPTVGLLGSFRFLATLNLALALVLYMRFQARNLTARIGAAMVAAGLFGLVFPLSWDQGLMNSGVYIYAPMYARMGGIGKILAAERIVEVLEGTDTTVAVHESPDGSQRFFTVNGKTDGGTGRDMATQILVGQLPLLLHANPQEVLVIGLGTGITLRGMSSHPTNRIDCVEISPQVIDASSYFEEDNDYVLCDPKVRLYVDDGRNLLLTRPNTYDVIVSEPSNPWQTGNANLFTADFYDLAASRLKPFGLFCQWLGLYDVTPENLRIACNTFLRTFPRALVFKAGSDLILVGAHHELAFDYQAMRRRLAVPKIRETLQKIDISSPGDLIALHYLYSEEALALFAGGAGLNTDDRPILEYSARYNLGEKTLGEFQRQNVANLLDARKKVLLPLVHLGSSAEEVVMALRDLAKGYARAGRSAEAELFMRKASEMAGRRAGTGPPGAKAPVLKSY